jgi:hypothetical protein
MGLSQRNFSPAVIDKIVSANAEQKSAGKAKRMLWKQAEISVSVDTLMSLTGLIGEELQGQLQQQAAAHAEGNLQPQYAELPNLVAVSVDGGRIMTRADAGRGIHEQAWKETKNACLLTMSSSPSQEDPHPDLPACFAKRGYVQKLVREIHSTTSPLQKDAENAGDSEEDAKPLELLPEREDTDHGRSASAKKWRPQRLVRTCLSSMVCSDDFGPLVAGEAQRRGFYQAKRRAFLGDGQAWNWTMHAKHFADFVPITDFVHPLGYLYEAAQVIAPLDHWAVYLQAATACWQGRVEDFLNRLRNWQATQPAVTAEKLPDHDPRAIVQRALTYLENNKPRMDYPAYRRKGLPVSTAMVESLIKEINFRVKGTEKFWNRPEGAERMLQVRAAALRDDDWLSQWILSRPGSYFYRPTTQQRLAVGA